MRLHRFVLALAVPLACGIASQDPARSEEYRGTMQQQMACTPDVWRLCSDQIPDVSQIVTCLRQNTPQLSNNCRAVFESQASAQQQQQPASRVPQQQTVPRARTPQPVQPQPLQPRPYEDGE